MPRAGQQRLSVQEKGAPESFIPANQEREILLSIMDKANEIAGAPDTISVVHGILDLMIEIAQADSANFFQLDLETNELVFSSVRGDAEGQHLIGLRLNPQLVFPNISISGMQPVVIGDLPSDPYWLRTVNSTDTTGKRNVINLPVTKDEQTLGVIQLFNFQQAELDLLQILSKRLAVEIDHRQKLEDTRQSNQRFRILVDVIGEVAGTLDRNRLLHLVTENASRLVDAERSSIFLVDPETREMLFQVAYRSPNPDLSRPTSREDRATVFPGPKQPSSNVPNRQLSSAHEQNGEFSYFNRSAITVPLSSEPLGQDRPRDRKQVFGGLMALNKFNANFHEEDAQLLQILADQASTFLQVAEMYESTGQLMLGIIRALVASIDAKDPYTQGHSQRVSDYSVMISNGLGLDEPAIHEIRIGSLFHDIGKIGIPDAILLKKGKLTAEEYEVIKQHPIIGVNILSQVEALEPMLPAIAEHHERLDGSGYPSKLAGRKISLMGRIVAVADVFDAMTSDRPYRPPFSVPKALSHLKDKAGVLYDPTCVGALEDILTRSNKPEDSIL